VLEKPVKMAAFKGALEAALGGSLV
jgi:hypothetical protein